MKNRTYSNDKITNSMHVHSQLLHVNIVTTQFSYRQRLPAHLQQRCCNIKLLINN